MAENDLGFSVRFEDIDKFDSDVNKVEKSIDDLSKNAVKSLDKAPEAATKSLRAQIREAQQMAVVAADTYGDYSKEAVAAYKEVANLKDKQEDLNRFIEYMNPDKFQVAAKIAGGLASGVQTASGAMALLGFEGENATKVMAKLQAVSNLAAGLQNWEDFKKSLKGLSNDIIPGIIKGFQGMGTAAKVAIAGTGIGLLITGVYELWTNWDNWFGSVEKTNKQLERFNEIDKEVQRGTAEKIANLKVEQSEVNGLTKQLIDGNITQERRGEIIKRLNELNPELLKGLDAHNLSEETLKERLKETNEFYHQRINLILKEGIAEAARKKQTELLTDTFDSLWNVQKTLNDPAQLQALQRYGITTDIINQSVAEGIADVKKQFEQLQKVIDMFAVASPDKAPTTGTKTVLDAFKPGEGFADIEGQWEKFFSDFESFINKTWGETNAKLMQESISNMMFPNEETFQKNQEALDKAFAAQQEAIRLNYEAIKSYGIGDLLNDIFTPKDESLEEKTKRMMEAIARLKDAMKQLGQAIKNQLVNVMGQFAENLGYAISGAGDFKDAFKEMMKGILPDVMKLIGMGLLQAAASPGPVPIYLRLALVAAGAALLIGSGLVRGLMDKANANDKKNGNNRPDFQAPGGAGSPVPQSGLGGFNQSDFGMNIDTLTVVVDGQGFQKTILDVIKTDKELKGE